MTITNTHVEAGTIHKGPVRFLAWLREDYTANGPRVFSEIEQAWEQTHGYSLPPEMLNRALSELLDSGEVTLDYSQGPFWWIPTGIPSNLEAAQVETETAKLEAALHNLPSCFLCHEPLTQSEICAHDFCLGKL